MIYLKLIHISNLIYLKFDTFETRRTDLKNMLSEDGDRIDLRKRSSPCGDLRDLEGGRQGGRDGDITDDCIDNRYSNLIGDSHPKSTADDAFL